MCFPPLHLNLSSSYYISDIPSSCSYGLRSPSSEIRFLAILSVEMVCRVMVLQPNRVFPTPPTSLCCLSFMEVLLKVFHGLLYLDNQLITFSWLSLLCGCAWRNYYGSDVMDVDLCRLRCIVPMEAAITNFSVLCFFVVRP